MVSKVSSLDVEVTVVLLVPSTTYKTLPPPNPPVLSKPAVASPTIFAAGIDVQLAALIAGNAPVKFAAGTFVKFAADIAGNVPLKFAAGKLVRFAPLPVNVVDVVTPVKNTSPS